jgi:hypothetical protein
MIYLQNSIKPMTQSRHVYFITFSLNMLQPRKQLNVKVKVKLCFIGNRTARNGGVLGNRGIAPRILDLGSR